MTKVEWYVTEENYKSYLNRLEDIQELDGHQLAFESDLIEEMLDYYCEKHEENARTWKNTIYGSESSAQRSLADKDTWAIRTDFDTVEEMMSKSSDWAVDIFSALERFENRPLLGYEDTLTSVSAMNTYAIALAENGGQDSGEYEFYRNLTEDLLQDGKIISSYGSSEEARRIADERRSKAVYKEDEWAVNLRPILEEDYEPGKSYPIPRTIQKIEAFTLQSIASAFSNKPPIDLEFSNRIIEEIDIENESALMRLALLEQDGRSYLQMARDEGYRNAAKLKAKRAALRKVNSQLEESLEKTGAIKYVRKAENIRDKARRFRYDLDRNR